MSEAIQLRDGVWYWTIPDALLRERESAKARVTDEMVEYASRIYTDASPLAVEAMRAVLEAVAPMLASARVPDGWQLVPIDPTDEMIEKGTDQHECAQGDPWYTDLPLSENDCNAIYKAMLAAAPKPEKEE